MGGKARVAKGFAKMTDAERKAISEKAVAARKAKKEATNV